MYSDDDWINYTVQFNILRSILQNFGIIISIRVSEGKNQISATQYLKNPNY